MTGAGENGAVSPHLRRELVRFVRALRGAGATVPPNAGTTAARALAEVGLADRERVAIALRASLLTDARDRETFDRLFDRFWAAVTGDDSGPTAASEGNDPGGGLAGVDDPDDQSSLPDPADEDVEAPGDGRDERRSIATTATDGSAGESEAVATARYSPTGTTREVEAGPIASQGGLGPAVEALGEALAGLEGRRYRPGGSMPDVRRALRASTSTGGTVTTLPRRTPERTAVRSVFLVDVSRSVLDAIERDFLVEFLRRSSRDWRDARVFFFDEALRNVTEAVDAPSTAAAYEALAAAETDWGGGTRIGESIAGLRSGAPHAVDRRTVVFVISDGLEMGAVDALERSCSWLARRASRVFWLNPLAASPAYEPTARGMAAALPYLDGLFAFAGPDDVAEIARQLRRRGPGAGVGLETEVPGPAGQPADERVNGDTA